MSASPDVIEAAIVQVEQGFAAFALGVNSKKPVTDHGFKNATTKPDWIRTQLTAASAGNYGIVWPEATDSPVVVFDLDNGSDGNERPWQDRLLELMARHGQLPRTKSTTTPSGGRHAFYRWPANVPIPPGDDLFGFTVRWPGRGYLVGPGSTIDGRRYEAGPDIDIADLPTSWVLAAVAEHPARRQAPNGLITISGGFELPERIPSGRRYATVRDYVASRYNAGLGSDELWELVRGQVAPRFEHAKTEAELRADFDRVMSKITERLGPPSRAPIVSPSDAIAAVSPIEVTNLADIAVEAVVWLWHRYLPVGSITLFDGNPGEGKSTVVADLIARLTRGGLWPDETPVGQAGIVLYITKEDDASTQVRPRIEAAEGDASKVFFVSSDLLFPRDTGRFRELLEATRPRLVLMDPLMSYLEGKVKTISDNEVRSAIMTPLADVARQTGCAIMVIRHFNKGAGQSALLRGAGSLGGLAGAARMVLALAPDPEAEDDRARVFGVVKSNFEAKPPSLRTVIESAPVEGFQMTVSRAAWYGPSDTPVSDLMERTREDHQLILDAEESLNGILDGAVEPVPATVIQNAMKAKGHSRNSIYNAAKALHVHIERVGFPSKSVWSLPRPLIVGTTGTTGTTAVIPPGTTGTTGSGAAVSESPTTGTTGTTGALQSSHSSLSSSGAGRPPAPAREDPEPVVVDADDTATWLRPCAMYDLHHDAHRWTPAGWVCDLCYPEEAA